MFLKLTAEDILSINMPSEIFTVRGIKKEYRLLAKKWHPDVNEGSNRSRYVMSKINALYTEGLSLIELGTFYEKERALKKTTGYNTSEYTKYNYDDIKPKMEIKKKCIEILRNNNKNSKLNYIHKYNFDLGTIYLSENVIMYEVSKKLKDLYISNYKLLKNTETNLINFELPHIIDYFEDFECKKGYIVIRKSKDILPISILINNNSNVSNALLIRKIGEGLFKSATSLKHKELMTLGIDNNSIFINVTNGTVFLYGSLFYMNNILQTIKNAPLDILNLVSKFDITNNEKLLIQVLKSVLMQLSIKMGLKLDDYYRWLLSHNSDLLEENLASVEVYNRAICTVLNQGKNSNDIYLDLCYAS